MPRLPVFVEKMEKLRFLAYYKYEHMMSPIRDKAYNALRKSETYIKADMVYVTKGGLWTTLSFLAGLSASIVTMIAFGNLLPRETYGTYSYLLSLGASLSFLTLSGAGIGVMRAVTKERENVIPAALRLQLKYNLVALATVLSAAFYYGYRGNTLFAWSLAILAFAYPLAEAFHVYVHILTGRKRFDTLTKITSIVTLLATLATVIILLLTQNILILIAEYAIMSLFPNIIVYLMVTRSIEKTAPNPEQLREMRRTAFHITGAGLIGTLAQYIDKILLFQIAGPVALAVYGFAIAGPDRLKSLVKNWMTIALPRLAERNAEEIDKVFYQRIRLALFIGALTALIYIVCAPFLFKLLLPKYLDSIRYSQAYALSLIFIPAVIYIGNIFYSQNMLRAVYISSTGIQALRIVLFLIFGWLYGTWGLIIAYFLTQVFSLIYCIVVWKKDALR